MASLAAEVSYWVHTSSPVLSLNRVAKTQHWNTVTVQGFLVIRQELNLYHITTPLDNRDQFNPKYLSDNDDKRAQCYLPPPSRPNRAAPIYQRHHVPTTKPKMTIQRPDRPPPIYCHHHRPSLETAIPMGISNTRHTHHQVASISSFKKEERMQQYTTSNAIRTKTKFK
jgi:hypothetical protein